MNHAQYDNELSIAAIALKSEANLSYFDLKSGQAISGKPMANLHLKKTMDRDYYLYCLGQCYELRLYKDFNSDACLIIHESKIFQHRLLSAAADKLDGKWIQTRFH